MAETDNDSISEVSIKITNILSSRLNKRERIQLVRRLNEQAKDSVKKRFQGNDDLPLIQGILGHSLTLEDMFDTLAGPGWESMLRDRFLLKSLLITPEDDSAPTYSEAEKADLIRLVRGMNENYLPAPLEAQAGHVIPVQTFANVLFMAANEGIAGHVKPAPEQEFLGHQFVDRYRRGYTLLFVLAVYQHYRLIDLSRKLAEQTENSVKHARIKMLRRIRRDLALHDLKYIIIQPAFLTNAQQYYSGLRQGLNTAALVEKLRRSVAELDMLLADAEEQEKKKRKEQHKKGEMVLAMLAEVVALPYYLYNLLAHALHLDEGWKWLAALSVTVLVTCTAVRNTWLVMNNRPPWKILRPLFPWLFKDS